MSIWRPIVQKTVLARIEKGKLPADVDFDGLVDACVEAMETAKCYRIDAALAVLEKAER